MTEAMNCKSCKREFAVEPEDFDFYKKISVPPPTWCPDCRQQRRYAWRNERVLYRRKCDLCGKSTVTIYSPNKPYKVYCPPCWWSDKWDSYGYGRDFDFGKTFTEQFYELQLAAPRIALLTKNSVNSEYTNHSGEDRNCYLCFGTFEGENDMYCTNMYGGKTRDCCDCYRITGGGELLYECVDTEKSYNCQYGRLLRSCVDCYYAFDCRNCKKCFMCSNLRNKEYCFLNKQYSKEDYQKKLEEYKLSSYKTREKLYKEWLELMEKSLHRFSVIENSVNVSGNMISNSKNSYHIFDGNDIEDSKYSHLSLDMKNSYDFYHVGIKCELVYEGHGMVRDYNVHFCHLCYDNSNLEYCDTCHNSENLFGCVSVKKGSHAIFNKRYEKGEYEELRKKIVEHMKATGEYGEYLSPKISPIGYNETQGIIYMPITEEEVRKRGWKWEKEVPGTFGKETIKPEDIPDDIKDVGDSITKEVFMCLSCSRNYNIIQPEIQLYKRLGVPVPRLCPDCRYRRKIAIRPPRKLWHRQCMCELKHGHHSGGRCPNEFETPYSPGRPEMVYCEECYNAEVV
ncbi:MAG: hypothetical protein HY378_00950 [Candidatus Brennerbacteria bacterium]|nr:hypothetical protein [Candidatus Brennerbacteria bacterium]